MLFKVKIFAAFVLSMAFSSPANGYIIRGQLKGFSPKWKNRIFLAAIRSINEFQAAADGMKINEAAIDNEGRFELKGNNLPEENSFYRLYLTDRDDLGMLFQPGNDQNFIHLLLSNGAEVAIQADLHALPFYFTQVTNSPYASQFTDFYKQIYNISSLNYYSPDTPNQLNQKKFFELIKSSIAKNHNPYYTIFTLSQLDWLTLYPSNREFFSAAVAGLQQQLPSNHYTAELTDKLQLVNFQTSSFKRYLNIRNFITLLCLCVIFIGINIYLLTRTRQNATVSDKPSINMERLTQKELEIANLAVQGKSNKEISSMLFIEISTVKSHMSSIYQKLNVSRRQDLTDKLNPSYHGE